MLHEAPLIKLPDDLMPNMVAPSIIDPYSWMNASHGSAAVVDTQGPQTLDTISWDMYTDSGELWQQQQQQQQQSMTLGASGHTTGRALHWQRDGDSTWAHAQVRVEDQIHDSYVNPLMQRFPTQKIYPMLQNDIAVASGFVACDSSCRD